MYPRKDLVLNQQFGPASGFVDSTIISDVLWHHQTLFVLHNVGPSGLSYQIMATPDYYPAAGVAVQWIQIFPAPYCDALFLNASLKGALGRVEFGFYNRKNIDVGKVFYIF